MGVLADNQRTLGVFLDQLDHILDGRVHNRNDVEAAERSRLVVGAALEVNGPGRVGQTDVVGHRDEIRTVAGLVSQRPDNDRRVVLIPLDHRFAPRQEGVFPLGFVGQDDVFVPKFVAFDIGLIHHV